MTNQQQIVNNVIQARAKQIVELVNMDMSLEWAIEQVKNSTTLSAKSMDRVISLAKEMIGAE